MSVRIVIVDDHRLVRESMKMLLGGEPDVEVVGEAGDGESALEACEVLKPDVVLVDLLMPGMTGWQLIAVLKGRSPGVRVIAVSAHDTVEHVARTMNAGASGYVLKESSPQELMAALRAVTAGKEWVPSRMLRRVIDLGMKKLGDSAAARQLTLRQRNVLRRMAEGASTRQIALELDISVKTAEAHRAQIMGKLGIRDTAGLVRYAIRNGITGL